MCVSRVFYCFNSVLKLSLWYLQFQARSSHHPTPGICGAFSNFSFPSFSWHVVHFKFPDYPQCKNIKNELITIVWVGHALFRVKGLLPLTPNLPHTLPHTHKFSRSQDLPLPSSTREWKDGGKKLRHLCGTRYRIRKLLVEWSRLGGID